MVEWYLTHTAAGQGTGDWADAYAKAKALVAQMTNDEKQTITIGYTSLTNGCSGNSGNVSRLNFPGLCLNDAGNGLRATDGTSGYPSGIHAGPSWNKALANARASYMGQEFKTKGVNVALGPVVAPLGRVATGGRNWEGFSADPYLSGSLAYQSVLGLQKSVIACTKHFITYEQETNRNPEGYNASYSSNLDDKTMHELYLWPFVDAVKAGSGSIMCSYNRINGSYGCQNSATMNGLLKTELGFQGFVVTDWGGQHTGIASANAGLDMAMPDSPYWVDNLSTAVANGSMTQDRLDDMATRILATWYKLNPLQNPGSGMPKDLLEPHEFVNARNPASKETIYQSAIEGHVLVKNTGSLPLKAPGLLSLFGYDAYNPAMMDPSNSVVDVWGYGLESVANVTNANAPLLLVTTNYTNAPPSARAGTLISGGGSGATTPAYISAPYDAIQQQAYEDGTFLLWDFTSQDPNVDGASSACLVFLNEFASEGFDRSTLGDPWSDQLVMNVASKCNNTIVSIHNAGIRIVDAWVDHPNVTALIYSHLPGQDSGRALVDLLYGKQPFSGRLPYTVGRNASDYGDLLNPTVPTNTSDYYTQSNYTEGVYIDYKSFIARNITPRFEFGFGLTSTTFNYSDLQIDLNPNVSHAALPSGCVQEGGQVDLWDQIAAIGVTITNTGNMTAAEVAQLYIGIPGGPEKQLRGFSKDSIAPGDSCRVIFEVTRRELSSWDTNQQSWLLQSGSYNVYVGKSVLDIQLTGTLVI